MDASSSESNLGAAVFIVLFVLFWGYVGWTEFGVKPAKRTLPTTYEFEAGPRTKDDFITDTTYEADNDNCFIRSYIRWRHCTFDTDEEAEAKLEKARLHAKQAFERICRVRKELRLISEEMSRRKHRQFMAAQRVRVRGALKDHPE